jgi:hypothetical protein
MTEDPPRKNEMSSRSAEARRVERDARRAAELRDNLRRRKAQARAKAEIRNSDRKT